MKRKSRLSKKQEVKIKKNLLITAFASILIIISLFKFGIPFLVNASLIVSGSKASKMEITEDKTDFIAAPVLNDLPSATNSAKLIVSGFAEKDTIAELFVNNNVKDDIKVKESGEFSFDYILNQGENEIKVRVVKEDKKSSFSPKYTVLFKKTAPEIEISTPFNGEELKGDDNTVLISGKTNASDVLVNDFKGVVNGDGTFSYNYSLKEGENIIKIIAIEQAGNKTEKEIRVNYSR